MNDDRAQREDSIRGLEEKVRELTDVVNVKVTLTLTLTSIFSCCQCRSCCVCLGGLMLLAKIGHPNRSTESYHWRAS